MSNNFSVGLEYGVAQKAKSSPLLTVVGPVYELHIQINVAAQL